MSDSNISIDREFTAQAHALGELTTRAVRVGIDFLVVGALARDIVISGTTPLRPDRATKDIDIAVAVDSWAELQRLTEGLETVGRSTHKFLVQGFEVDAIPFRGIETANRHVLFPDENEMNVLGLQEALGSAVTATIDSVSVRVASLPAQIILKILAWQDRHNFSRKDAIDLRMIILAYDQEPYVSGSYADERLMLAYDFDTQLIGAHRLGSESMMIMDPPGGLPVIRILERQVSDERLLPRQMRPWDEARNLLLLGALLDGMKATASQ